MSTKCIPGRTSGRRHASIAFLALALLGAGCKNERERAEGAVREQARDVREQAGKVIEERRELGGEVRELQQRQQEAWTQWAKSKDVKVEFKPDGSVVVTKPQPPSGTPPADEALRQAVTTRLTSSESPALKNLAVTAKDGTVALRGSVPTFKDATTAVEEALKVEGISKLVSYLTYGS